MKLLWFFLICCFSHLLAAEESEGSAYGSAIITYQTDPNGERLDRVRFWLKSADQYQQMFPKGSAYIDDPTTKTRMVVAESLPPGKYFLEFIVPNKDGYFEEVPVREFTINRGSAVKIDQTIKPKLPALHMQIGAILESAKLPKEEIAAIENPHASEPIQIEPIQNDPIQKEQPIQILPIENGAITVINNIPNARWIIYNRDIKVYSGRGTQYKIPLAVDVNYHLQAEDIEGYTKRIDPSEQFPILLNQTTVAEIYYMRQFGYIEVSSLLPDREEVTLEFLPDNPELPAVRANLHSEGGRLHWKSPEIPTGSYTLFFYPANKKLLPLEPQKISVLQGENLLLTPEFFEGRQLKVTSNTPDAVYTLTDEKTYKTWSGKGKEFTFEQLLPGQYILSYSTSDYGFYIPPKPERITIRKYQDAEVNAHYNLGGKISIASDEPRTDVTIESVENLMPTRQEELVGGRGTYLVPPGKYRISYSKSRGVTPQPVEILVQSTQVQDIAVSYGTNAIPPSPIEENAEKGQLILITNTPDALYTIKEASKMTEKELAPEKSVGTFKGKYQIITLKANTPYQIVFGEINRYKAPNPTTVELKKGETKTLSISYIPINQMVSVAEGQVIVGDPFKEGKQDELPARTVDIDAFSIGIYQVTNAQYAYWLTESVNSGKAVYGSESEKKGQVMDKEGQLLCKTLDAEPNSQINVVLTSNGNLAFIPIPGKDHYPVVYVTWQGAISFAQDNEGRLPTEAEWEKAAGMALTSPGQPLKKFRYGFSKDTIDKTWCNYKLDNTPIEYFQVLTTEVGFYNGTNRLPLGPHDTMQFRTNNAYSPVGAYDMSGNVWEWVNDWYSAVYYKDMPEKNPQGPTSGTKKVVKGGCYDSLADGVRVSERLALPLGYCDGYTGFRIAK